MVAGRGWSLLSLTAASPFGPRRITRPRGLLHQRRRNDRRHLERDRLLLPRRALVAVVRGDDGHSAADGRGAAVTQPAVPTVRTRTIATRRVAPAAQCALGAVSRTRGTSDDSDRHNAGSSRRHPIDRPDGHDPAVLGGGNWTVWHVDGAGSALLRVILPHSSPERVGQALSRGHNLRQQQHVLSHWRGAPCARLMACASPTRGRPHPESAPRLPA
jgi:hypothetical protein